MSQYYEKNCVIVYVNALIVEVNKHRIIHNPRFKLQALIYLKLNKKCTKRYELGLTRYYNYA